MTYSYGSKQYGFKEQIISAKEGSTELTLKEITPVRLLKNPFFEAVDAAYAAGASVEELRTLLGRGRAKKGMFEGDLDAGELEVGQVSAMIRSVKPAGEIVNEMIEEFNRAAQQLTNLTL